MIQLATSEWVILSMVKSCDWSYLENQIHQLQDLQAKEIPCATPSMDITSSIITQVAREADRTSVSDNTSKGI